MLRLELGKLARKEVEKGLRGRSQEKKAWRGPFILSVIISRDALLWYWITGSAGIRQLGSWYCLDRLFCFCASTTDMEELEKSKRQSIPIKASWYDLSLFRKLSLGMFLLQNSSSALTFSGKRRWHRDCLLNVLAEWWCFQSCGCHLARTDCYAKATRCVVLPCWHVFVLPSAGTYGIWQLCYHIVLWDYYGLLLPLTAKTIFSF